MADILLDPSVRFFSTQLLNAGAVGRVGRAVDVGCVAEPSDRIIMFSFFARPVGTALALLELVSFCGALSLHKVLSLWVCLVLSGFSFLLHLLGIIDNICSLDCFNSEASLPSHTFPSTHATNTFAQKRHRNENC